jgi:hypothetical protein
VWARFQRAHRLGAEPAAIAHRRRLPDRLWRLRFKLSLRDLAEILLVRSLVFSHEAVRDWETKLAPLLTDALRQRRRGKIGRSWYVDETYLKVSGRWQYLYRAIDSDGKLVDVYLSPTRDQAAAEAFFRSAITVTGIISATCSRSRNPHRPIQGALSSAITVCREF